MRNLLSILLVCCFITIGAAQTGPVQYFYDSGKLLSEGNLVSGKPDGYWKSYHESGKLKSEGNRLNFQLDSTWKFYNDKGIITSAITYKNGKKNGPRSTYDELGAIEYSENFVDDIRNGYTYSYYPNGKIKTKTWFDKGREDGWAYEFEQDSTIITRMQYKSGFLSFQEKINRKDKSGMRQGEWRTIYPDGKIQTEVTYRDDKKNGYYREYYPNGSAKLVILYKDDAIVTNNTESTAKFDSKVTYDKPTRTWNKGTYLDGRPIGLHVEYTDTSKKYSSKLYDNGVLSGEGMSDSLGLLQGFWKEF